MMSRQKLQELRAQAKTGTLPDRDQIFALIDQSLAAVDEAEGGPIVVAKRAELAERERQLGLALADLRSVLMVIEADLRLGHPLGPPEDSARLAARALFMTGLMHIMLKAKGPAWHRQWSWYTPRIAEEFDTEEFDTA